MSSPINDFPKTLADNSVAQALSFGKLYVTVKSLKTHQHITIRAICKTKSPQGSYSNSDFANATHVFFADPNVDDWREGRIGTFYPRSGAFYLDEKRTPADVLVFVAQQVLQFATWGKHHPQLEIVERKICRRCGASLDDNVSKDRGYGPDCYGLITGSKHVSRKKRGVPSKPTPTVSDALEAGGLNIYAAAARHAEIDTDNEIEREIGYYAHSDARRSDDR